MGTDLMVAAQNQPLKLIFYNLPCKTLKLSCKDRKKWNRKRQNRENSMACLLMNIDSYASVPHISTTLLCISLRKKDLSDFCRHNTCSDSIFFTDLLPKIKLN